MILSLQDVAVMSEVLVYVKGSDLSIGETDITIPAHVLHQDTSDGTTLLVWKEKPIVCHVALDAVHIKQDHHKQMAGLGFKFYLWVMSSYKCQTITTQKTASAPKPVIQEKLTITMDFDAYNSTLPNGIVLRHYMRR